mmetsp:Transcript_58412/g.96894  ORF Transcript_58412/g.96894 Transcript_58412/m.96894 type:complete len:262 (-) Transcript_58412:580-1365(-)
MLPDPAKMSRTVQPSSAPLAPGSNRPIDVSVLNSAPRTLPIIGRRYTSGDSRRLPRALPAMIRSLLALGMSSKRRPWLRISRFAALPPCLRDLPFSSSRPSFCRRCCFLRRWRSRRSLPALFCCRKSATSDTLTFEETSMRISEPSSWLPHELKSSSSSSSSSSKSQGSGVEVFDRPPPSGAGILVSAMRASKSTSTSSSNAFQSLPLFFFFLPLPPGTKSSNSVVKSKYSSSVSISSSFVSSKYPMFRRSNFSCHCPIFS